MSTSQHHDWVFLLDWNFDGNSGHRCLYNGLPEILGGLLYTYQWVMSGADESVKSMGSYGSSSLLLMMKVRSDNLWVTLIRLWMHSFSLCYLWSVVEFSATLHIYICFIVTTCMREGNRSSVANIDNLLCPGCWCRSRLWKCGRVWSIQERWRRVALWAGSWRQCSCCTGRREGWSWKLWGRACNRSQWSGKRRAPR